MTQREGSTGRSSWQSWRSRAANADDAARMDPTATQDAVGSDEDAAAAGRAEAPDEFRLRLAWPDAWPGSQPGGQQAGTGEAGEDWVMATEEPEAEAPSTDAAHDEVDEAVTPLLPALVAQVRSMEDLLDQMNGRLSRAGEATSVAADVRSVAQAVVELAASLSEQIAAARAEAVELHDRLALDEIAALRDEISQLRRRLGVRAKAPVELTDSQIDDVADRVVSRMVELFEVDASTAEAAAPAEPRAPRSKRSRPLVGRDGG